MRKIAAFGVVAASAVLMVGLSTGFGEAGGRHHRHHSGVSIELFVGAPYYPEVFYVDPGYQRVHRPWRVVVVDPGWRAHVAWCYDRYRSYRASDNTFNPYFGPRRECISPYFG